MYVRISLVSYKGGHYPVFFAKHDTVSQVELYFQLNIWTDPEPMLLSVGPQNPSVCYSYCWAKVRVSPILSSFRFEET